MRNQTDANPVYNIRVSIWHKGLKGQAKYLNYSCTKGKRSPRLSICSGCRKERTVHESGTFFLPRFHAFSPAHLLEEKIIEMINNRAIKSEFYSFSETQFWVCRFVDYPDPTLFEFASF